MKISGNNNLAGALLSFDKRYNDKSCLVCHDQSISYAQLKLNSIKTANGLIREGAQKGARVAVISKDCIQNYEVFFACALSQTVMLGVNWRLQKEEIDYMLTHSGAEFLFISAEFYDKLKDLELITSGALRVIIIDKDYPAWRDAQANTELSLQYDENDAVVQLYTSGTTGQPKGVVLAHCTFFNLLQGMADEGDLWMDLNQKDTLLLSLPIFHIGGLWWAVQGLLVGAKGLIMEYFSAPVALDYIHQHKATKVALVPAMIQFMLAEPDCQQRDFSSVEALLYGASPISPALLKQAMSTFDCRFFQIYGMTETGNMAVCLRPDDHSPEQVSLTKAAGKALPGVQIKVVNSNSQTLATGQTGEIVIKSPSRMLGYWNNEEETQKVMQDGWIRTGDVGYLDEHGYLYICDRIKDMIIYASENIYPAEIEAVINDHPGVKEVAVVGKPDERWGEIVLAFVVPQANASLKKREIVQCVQAKLADFKAPKAVEFIDALPRNASGKVLKRSLRSPLWNGRDRQIN
mgnify:CR=1 FL=1|jgi:acyl-CoA synthetase (AMP-forming)/AMP-acid ligase II